MKITEALQKLQIGKSVAEQDDELDKYFIETVAFRSLLSGKVDVIAGDKGTGKSAIYRMLQKKYREYPELKDIELISEFNPTGNPVFQRLADGQVYSEGVYRTIWKAYFLSLVGNWLIDIFGENYNPEISALNRVLLALNLNSFKTDPTSTFQRILDFFASIKLKKAGLEFTVTESGMPIVAPTLEFGGVEGVQSVIYCDDFLSILESALEACDVTVWLAMDRLDEAFVGFEEVETPALRALLRTYLDLSKESLKNLP